jgi:hypothetical protein
LRRTALRSIRGKRKNHVLAFALAACSCTGVWSYNTLEISTSFATSANPQFAREYHSMRNVAFLHRVSLWLFATAVFCVGTSVVVVPSSAQPAGEADHLKCYQARDSNLNKRQIVKTENVQFGTEECTVFKKAPQICAPTIKDGGDDLLGGPVSARDYICYKAICKPTRKTTVHAVEDQFGRRLMRVGNARRICAPAQKSEPLVCGQTAPQCDGECPENTQCVSKKGTASGTICVCQ